MEPPVSPRLAVPDLLQRVQTSGLPLLGVAREVVARQHAIERLAHDGHEPDWPLQERNQVIRRVPGDPQQSGLLLLGQLSVQPRVQLPHFLLVPSFRDRIRLELRDVLEIRIQPGPKRCSTRLLDVLVDVDGIVESVRCRRQVHVEWGERFPASRGALGLGRLRLELPKRPHLPLVGLELLLRCLEGSGGVAVQLSVEPVVRIDGGPQVPVHVARLGSFRVDPNVLSFTGRPTQIVTDHADRLAQPIAQEQHVALDEREQTLSPEVGLGRRPGGARQLGDVEERLEQAPALAVRVVIPEGGSDEVLLLGRFGSGVRSHLPQRRVGLPQGVECSEALRRASR